MSSESAGGSRQGESGTHAFPEFDLLPVGGDMSQLLGGAGDRITKALEEADEATKTIFDQARHQAREHNERALAEAERDTQERIAKMIQVTEEVNARAEALRLRARELADLMRQSTDTLTGDLGLADEAAASAQLERRGGGGGSAPPPVTPDLETDADASASK